MKQEKAPVHTMTNGTSIAPSEARCGLEIDATTEYMDESLL